jgi:adenosylcobinamide-GDP ribazoletransferase
MNNFLLMIQLFTKFPIRKEIDFHQETFSKGVVYFSVIGLLIGGVAAAAAYLLNTTFNMETAALGMMFTVMALTGALHLDGLADTMDGILSARKREQMLVIMKDSRIGTHGVLALVMTLALKYVFLLQVDPQVFHFMVLALPIVGRSTMGILLFGTRYAREEGLGNLFIGKTRPVDSLITGSLGLLMIFTVLGLKGILAFLLVIATMRLFRFHVERLLGGITGDVLGAVNELSELLFIPMYLLIEKGGSLL